MKDRTGIRLLPIIWVGVGVLVGMSIVVFYPRFGERSRFEIPGKGRDGEVALGREALREGAVGFDWDNNSASTTLQWAPCYREVGPTFECSRLLVPLNHSEPSGPQASIALARIPSSLGPTHPSYRGPILLNPGGPGGSCVSLLLRSGQDFSAILGPQYDIVGFDPRGVARSRPVASLFDSELERRIWERGDASQQGLHVVDVESKEGIARAWSRAKVIGGLAERTKGVLRYINTEQTVRDMKVMVEVHGEERKLMYWGLSYGSVLGSVFATMFPDMVERIVIDGIVDMDDYFQTERRLTSLTDTHKTLSHFFQSCHAAGPSSCPFWARSPSHIQRNLDALFDHVKETPIPVHGIDFYGLIDYPFLRWTVFMSLYSPYASFKPLADALSDPPKAITHGSTANDTKLDFGAGLKLWKLFQGPAIGCEDVCPSCPCHSSSRTENENPTMKDSEDALEKSPGSDVEGEWKGREWVGTWATMRADCSFWPDMPKPDIPPLGANTSWPILVIGNTEDPVTPLFLANEITKRFPRSVLLIQDGPGHTSIAAPSLCKAQYVRAYFDAGKLPKEGTVCKVDGAIIPRVETGIWRR